MQVKVRCLRWEETGGNRIFFLGGGDGGRGNGFKRAGSAGSVQVHCGGGTWGHVPPPGDGKAGRSRPLRALHGGSQTEAPPRATVEGCSAAGHVQRALGGRWGGASEGRWRERGTRPGGPAGTLLLPRGAQRAAGTAATPLQPGRQAKYCADGGTSALFWLLGSVAWLGPAGGRTGDAVPTPPWARCIHVSHTHPTTHPLNPSIPPSEVHPYLLRARARTRCWAGDGADSNGERYRGQAMHRTAAPHPH